MLTDKKIPDNFKEMALDVIYQVCDFKRVVFTKNPELLKKLIDTLCHVVSISKSPETNESNFQDSTL